MIAILGLIVGLLLGILMPFHIPQEYSNYAAVAILAAMDSILGGFILLNCSLRSKVSFIKYRLERISPKK